MIAIQASGAQPPALFGLFTFLFVGLGVAAVASLAHVGGWAELGKRYPGPAPEGGKTFSFSSASIGGLTPVNYANCLFVQVGRAGLGLSLFFPFRFQHPPLFIPWTAVRECRKGWFVLWPGVAVYLAGSDTRIVFRGWTGSAVLDRWDELRRAERATRGVGTPA